MRRIFTHRPQRRWVVPLRLAAAAVALATIAACADTPTGPRGLGPDGRPLAGTTIQLPGIGTTVCQYGGEYPDCKSAPIDDGYDPNAPQTPPPSTSGTGDGGGGTSTSDPPPDTTQKDTTKNPCNTSDPILNSPDFATGAQSLWAQSNYGPSTPQADRREQYSWIVQTSTGYSFVPIGTTPQPCGMGSAEYLSPPPGTVAFIHTHPWTDGEMQTTCGPRQARYFGLPSEDDVAAAAQLTLPGYILDTKRITQFDGNSGPAPANAIQSQTPRCGY
jgi:hypothetical protein